MARWLRLASHIRDFFPGGVDAEVFLEYPFPHLDALREGSKEVHSVMAGSSMTLVRFDPVDVVPHPFLDQEAVVVNGVVSDGPWLSPTHTEDIREGDEQRFGAPKTEGVDDIDVSDFAREKLVPMSQHHLKTSPL